MGQLKLPSKRKRVRAVLVAAGVLLVAAIAVAAARLRKALALRATRLKPSVFVRSNGHGCMRSPKPTWRLRVPCTRTTSR